MNWQQQFKDNFKFHYETRQKVIKFIENLLKEKKKSWKQKYLKNQNQGKLGL